MELDDFKEQWRNIPEAPVKKEALQQQVDALEKSGKRIRRVFMVESMAIACIGLFFVSVVFFFAGNIAPFFYKMVAVIFLGSATTYYRLYKSQRWLNSMDYSKDLKSNLTAFLSYYKKTLSLGLWSSCLISLCLFIVMFTDNFFLALEMPWKVGVIVYIIGIQLFTVSYIKKVYGKPIRAIEPLLET
ncbi:MAG: hypothetical protein ABS46_01035 [Cytophagaceae bacterium SCN 52-12]|nr:MAG: hypothetical protein ABS46_01035 [Cytophagaceae bacterium SCN 52-12]